MQVRVVVVTAAALVISGAAGCSSGPASFNTARGGSPPGLAHLTIDGENVGTTSTVRCAIVKSLTTIQTGDNKSGMTVMLSDADRLSVQFVRIRNADGFTGDYDRDLEGSAAIALSDSAYHINGTALGYSSRSVEPQMHTFRISVAC